eukprot:767076-Hanusia_phi.AAC.5
MAHPLPSTVNRSVDLQGTGEERSLRIGCPRLRAEGAAVHVLWPRSPPSPLCCALPAEGDSRRAGRSAASRGGRDESRLLLLSPRPPRGISTGRTGRASCRSPQVGRNSTAALHLLGLVRHQLGIVELAEKDGAPYMSMTPKLEHRKGSSPMVPHTAVPNAVVEGLSADEGKILRWLCRWNNSFRDFRRHLERLHSLLHRTARERDGAQSASVEVSVFPSFRNKQTLINEPAMSTPAT